MKKNEQSLISESISDKIKNIISINRINEIAKGTKFIQRNSDKITAENFFALNVFYEKKICVDSLSDLCNSLSENDNIEISSQSLDERFNSKSVKFLKTVFEEILTSKTDEAKLNTSFATNFKRITITDSTGFQLPNEYEEMFKGYSGSATKSAIKIQLTNDLITGNILSLDISDGRKSDCNHLPFLENITKKDDLAIKDLGYYSFKHFKTIEKMDSYYLSRLKLNTSLYYKNPTPEKFKDGRIKKTSEYIKIDLLEEVAKLKENESKELSVYIGGEGNTKIKTRVIIYKLPESLVAQKRMNQIKMENKKRIKVSEKLKILNSVNIFITNVDSTIISKDFIYLIYSLRWQIELMFKIWKSICCIDKIKKVKLDRFLCHLYGSLISILLSTQIVFDIRNAVYKINKKEISEFKAFKTVWTFFKRLGLSLLKHFVGLQNILNKIISMTLKNGIKSKKGRKKTFCEILALVESNTNLKSKQVA